MKQIHCLSVLFAAFALAACGGHKERPAEVQIVRLDTVAPGETQTVLQFPGRVKAAQDISLSFRVAGTLERVHADDGSRVREGQLLAELDPTDYQVQLDATEAEYRQVKAEAERVMALYAENGTTPNANDKAVYGLKQIEAKYKHHSDQLAYTRLYAPFSGYVQKRLFDAHETVGAGMPVFTMVSADAPEVEISLPASEYIRRERYSQYHCTFDVFPGQTYALRLISIAPKANANQLYTVRLQLVPEGKEVPSAGMNTMVSIGCAPEGDPVLSVPTRSVLHENGRSYLFIYDEANGTVRREEVSLMQLLSDGYSLVRSDALKPGDRIVSSGVHHLKDGERVKPLPSATDTNVGGLL